METCKHCVYVRDSSEKDNSVITYTLPSCTDFPFFETQKGLILMI